MTKWSREVAAALVVNMASFEEGLGRVMYVVSSLEYERPFLAPLYRFMTMHPRGSTRRVLAYVRFILNYIAEEVSGTRHYPCDSVVWNQTCSPEWMHRQVTTGREWEKGYLTGTIKEEQAWFSLEVSPEDFSVGFRQRQETITDHLNSGSARSTPLAEAFCGAATRGTAVPSNHLSHMDRQQR